MPIVEDRRVVPRNSPEFAARFPDPRSGVTITAAAAAIFEGA